MSPKQKYASKLKDPRWQQKRLRIFERDKWVCRRCGATKSQLHAHHTTYVKGVDPWDQPDSDIITLCEFCHKVAHAKDHFIGVVVCWTQHEEGDYAAFLCTDYDARGDDACGIYFCKKHNGEDIWIGAGTCQLFEIPKNMGGDEWEAWIQSIRADVAWTIAGEVLPQ